MNPPLIQRPHYFAGEALLTDDFQCEQQYHMEMLAFDNRSLYTYGIASGLEVYWQSDSTANQVQVSPGMAIDRTGQQIILLQPQVIRMTGIEQGATYFLTINYNEVYADYTDETGVAGYKRIVQQPQIQYERNLKEPGLHILLAVISFSTQGNINQLTYKSGRFERRYVGSTLGSVNFITEGTGIDTVQGSMPDSLSAFAGANWKSGDARILSRKESTGTGGYLEVDAQRTQFMGLTTTRSNLGIGIDQPLANLQLEAIKFKGKGTLSSDGQLVTLSVSISPFFQIGDVLISDASVAYGPPQQRTIVAVYPDQLQVKVNAAFNPALQSISYTYIRSTLARFSAANNSNLLRIDIDGAIGLGMQASPSTGMGSSGPNALVITPDRKVGISLPAGSPQAELDVGGQIRADGLSITGQIQTGKLIASGAIQAQSFEGNGSKLQGLPILSYWTKESVGTPTSNLYYIEGNVGVRDTNPLASLSVGGGQSFIGSGLVTSITNSVLQGYQTAFQDQINPGDTITIGMLVEQIGVVSQIVNDTQLLLEDQLPIVVKQSPYSYQPASGTKQTGQGLISSNGTTITGAGTNFTSTLQVGDKIMIDSFRPTANVSQSSKVTAINGDTSLTLDQPYSGAVSQSAYSYQTPGGPVTAGSGTISTNGTAVTGVGTTFSTLAVGDSLIISPSVSNPNLPRTLLVQSVTSQNQLTLYLPSGSTGSMVFDAATSAYVVTPSLLGCFRANGDNSVLSPSDAASIPPALLIATNSNINYPNTVAINVEVDQINSQYALQVNGNTSIGGNTDLTNLTVQTLLATQSVTVNGDGSAANLLSVGEKAAGQPLLTVTQTNVVVGPGGAPAAQYQLDVAGVMHASGNILSDAGVQAASLTGNSLSVAGCSIDTSGNVKMIGTRVEYTQKDLTNNGTQFTQTASTDGFVVATVGHPTYTENYTGTLEGFTKDTNGNVTCYVYTTALAYKYEVPSGKKGTATIYIPVPGSFVLPVQKGESWNLQLTWVNSVGSAPPDIEFYWVPLGIPPSPHAALSATAPMSRSMAASPMMARMQQLRDELQSGRMQSSMQATAQQAIDQRVNDLTQVLGDATHMSDNPQGRTQFIQDLQKIVCSATPPGTNPDNQVDEQSIQDLIDTFGELTGHQFTPAQRSLLDKGVRALVEINDNDANRHDLSLIRNNLNLFIDNMQQVLQTQFDKNDRRRLMTALTRLVGDGSQGPSTAPPAGSGTGAPAINTASGSGNSGNAATTPPATGGASISDQIRQHVESALGNAVTNDVKPALGKVVNDVLQGATQNKTVGNLMQRIEQVLPNGLTQEAKQALQAKLSQLFTQNGLSPEGTGSSSHPATSSFFQEVEQALETSLNDNDKQGLHNIINGLLSGQVSKEDAGHQLLSTVEGVAKGVFEDKAKTLVTSAVMHLLATLL